MRKFIAGILLSFSFSASQAKPHSFLTGDRTFSCVFIGQSVTYDSFTQNISFGLPFDARSVKMKDSKKGEHFLTSLSGLPVERGGNSENIHFVSKELSADPQESRDDDPEGRQGWGGTMFLKGTSRDPFDPSEGWTLVTKGTREQIDEDHRTYSLSIFRGDGIENPSNWIVLGTLDCEENKK